MNLQCTAKRYERWYQVCLTEVMYSDGSEITLRCIYITNYCSVSFNFGIYTSQIKGSELFSKYIYFLLRHLTFIWCPTTCLTSTVAIMQITCKPLQCIIQSPQRTTRTNKKNQIIDPSQNNGLVPRNLQALICQTRQLFLHLHTILLRHKTK